MAPGESNVIFDSAFINAEDLREWDVDAARVLVGRTSEKSAQEVMRQEWSANWRP